MHVAELDVVRALCGHPQRIVWAVAEADGQRSICPLGWKMDTSITPRMMAISVAPTRFTHELITASGEVVLAWPGEDLAETTLYCGTHSGREVDKFAIAGLTPLDAHYVQAPLVGECITNMECRVTGRLPTGDHTIFALEILAAWVHERPTRPLCQVGNLAGYDVLLEEGFYRFGVVKNG